MESANMDGRDPIADRLQTDPSLAGQAAKLRAILESAVDAVITIDRNGIIMTVNPADEKLFGYAYAEFIGRNVHFLMPEPYHSEHDGYIRAYHQTGRKKIIGIGREVLGRRADGTTFPSTRPPSAPCARPRKWRPWASSRAVSPTTSTIS